MATRAQNGAGFAGDPVCGAGVALSRDLGYTYGRYQLRSKTPDAQTLERGSYLHVWKKEKSGWKLILDLTNVDK